MYTVTSCKRWDNRVYTVARRRQTSRVGQSCVHRGKAQTDIKGGTIVCTPWQGADRHQGWDNRVYTVTSCKRWDNRVYTVARRRQTSRVGQSCVHRRKAQTGIQGWDNRVYTVVRSNNMGWTIVRTPWQAADRHQEWDNRVQYTVASRRHQGWANHVSTTASCTLGNDSVYIASTLW